MSADTLLASLCCTCDSRKQGNTIEAVIRGCPVEVCGSDERLPLLPVLDVVDENELFLWGINRPIIEYETLLEVCFRIFVSTCRDRHLSKKKLHTMVTMGYVLLAIILANANVRCRNKPVYSDRYRIRQRWQILYQPIWSAIQLLREDETFNDWRRRLDCRKEL